MKFFPDWLSRNFRIKLGLFLLAVMLWFLVVSDEIVEQSISIPIIIDGVREGKVIANNPPDHADVRIQATGKQLLRMMYLDKPFLHIDLSTINHFYTFEPRTDMIVIPGGVIAEPLYITAPDSIPVVLSDNVKRKVKVIPDINLTTAAGYVIKGQVVSVPDSIKLTGASEILKKTEHLSTAYVELTKLKRNTELMVEILPPASSGVLVSPSEVRLKIQIEKIGQRKLIGIPVTVVNVPRGREVIVDPIAAEIQLTGGVSVIGGIAQSDINAWVDFRKMDIARGSKTPVMIDPMDGVEIISIEPEEVRLIVRRQ
ncbi:YbbR-like domain-containing protein [Calditrichota bacterium]